MDWKYNWWRGPGLLFQTHAKVMLHFIFQGMPGGFWGNVSVLGKKAGNECFNMNVRLWTQD